MHSVTTDFEKALWRAVKSVLPNVGHHVCTFHMTQAIYLKIQNVSVVNDYQNNRIVYKLCRLIMALLLIYPPTLMSFALRPSVIHYAAFSITWTTRGLIARFDLHHHGPPFVAPFALMWKVGTTD